MSAHLDLNLTITKATEIIVAYLSGRTVDPTELPRLVREVREALCPMLAAPEVDTTPPSSEEPLEKAPSATDVAVPTRGGGRMPAVPVESSINPDFIYSLEDGKPYRSLRRHLMAKYGMTPDDYRRKWSLPADYPMVAPSFAKQRSEVAKRSGLGTTKAARAPVRKSR